MKKIFSQIQRREGPQPEKVSTKIIKINWKIKKKFF